MHWVVLLVASLIFYGWMNPKLPLLLLSILLVQYCLAILIARHTNNLTRKIYLFFSIFLSISILFFFKYTHFFLQAITPFQPKEYAIPEHIFTVFSDMILPLGISFFTFQIMGYVIDVYKGKIKPEYNFGILAVFISFFPQLIAGPIEKAQTLLPQIRTPCNVTYDVTINNLLLFMWGFFKKLVIADRIGIIINPIYTNPEQFSGWQMIIAAVLFFFQIYCDFSGYIDIARGSAGMLGVQLTPNFKQPYLATSVKDFWNRWNITLSNWFKEYIYIPLGGNRRGPLKTGRNIIIVFLISGIWHGSGWNFIVWGLLHGIWIISENYLFFRYIRLYKKGISNLTTVLCWMVTFIFLCSSFVIFRASSLSDAWLIISKSIRLHSSQFLFLIQTPINKFDTSVLVIALALLLIVDIAYVNKHLHTTNKHPLVVWGAILLLMLSIMNFGIFEQQAFIYFDF